MMAYCSLYPPMIVGEWDDYCVPVASILNDHNLSISEDDEAYFRELYPDWSIYTDYHFSGFMSRDGIGELPYYFPVYSIVCIPATLLLQMLNLSTAVAFSYTNLACLMTALLVVFYLLKCDDKRKNLLIVLLSLNPIIFYLSWPSGEVFIYSMLVIGLTFWYNKQFNKSAVFVSLAGMLNPTIMSVGIAMIIEYLIRLVRVKPKEEKWGKYVKSKLYSLFGYGCCYFIAIIPLVYNYYNTGHINLTAAQSAFTQSTESTLSRAWAYIIDLNYGLLPYYPVLIAAVSILFFVSIIKRKIRFWEWFATFIINVLLYSIMTHINSGMSGIARYNAWGCLLLIFAVVLVGADMLSSKKQRVLSYTLYVGAAVTASIVFWYNPHLAQNTQSTYFTPIAEMALDYCPDIYNPLYSTFNSRVMHIDGAYNIATPIIYSGKDGKVHKILATSADKSLLLDSIHANTNEEYEWFKTEVDLLSEKPSYINIPSKYIFDNSTEMVDKIVFSIGGYNADNYAVNGLSIPEGWGSWTDGNELFLQMRSKYEGRILHAEIACSVYGEEQNISIYVNDVEVYRNQHFMGNNITFNFDNPGLGEKIKININIPNSRPVSQYGLNDRRVLGLGLTEITFAEVLETTN